MQWNLSVLSSKQSAVEFAMVEIAMKEKMK
jgi:hypothetical protein